MFQLQSCVEYNMESAKLDKSLAKKHPFKRIYDNVSSITDMGYGSLHSSSLTLNTVTSGQSNHFGLDNISLISSSISCKTATSCVPIVEVPVETSCVRTVTSFPEYSSKFDWVEPLNGTKIREPAIKEKFEKMCSTSPDNYFSYTGRVRAEDIPPSMQEQTRSQDETISNCFKCTWKRCSMHTVESAIKYKNDEVHEIEKKAVRERCKEAAVEEMERVQSGHRYWTYVHESVAREERKKEEKRMKKEAKKAKKLEKKNLETHQTDNGLSKKVSAVFTTLKAKFSGKLKNKTTESTVPQNSLERGKETMTAKSSTNKRLASNENSSDGQRRQHDSNYEPRRKRKSSGRLAAIEEEEEKEEEMEEEVSVNNVPVYDGHPNLREKHGMIQTKFDREMGIQEAFTLDQNDVDMTRKSKEMLTTQAVFRYLYWKIGMHNTDTPDQRCALLHPAVATQFFEKINCNLPKTMSDNICYRNYENGKPEILIAPIHRSTHFAVAIFGMEKSGNVRVFVLDSVESETKMLTQIEAKEIAKAYFEVDERSNVKVEYSTRKEALIQDEGSNDCGVHAINNVNRYLEVRDASICSVRNKMRLKNPHFESFEKRQEFGEQLERLIVEDNIIFNNNEKNEEKAETFNQNSRILKMCLARKNNCKSKYRKMAEKKVRTEREKVSQPSSLETSFKIVRSHKKKTAETKLTDEDHPQKNEFDLNQVFGSEDLTLALSNRDKSKLTNRMKDLVQKIVKDKASSSDCTPSLSSFGSPEYSPVKNSRNHVQKELTFKQKETAVELFFNQRKNMEYLIERYNLCPSIKSARKQLWRMKEEVDNKNPNKRQAQKLLKERVETIISYKDDVLMEDIHAADLQRTAIEQSVCFGLKNFKGSTKWVHGMKKDMNLVSRHIYNRKAKASADKEKEIEDSINDFLQNVVPDIRRKYAADHIYNVDQTGLEYELKMNRTLTKKGRNKVERVVQRKNDLTHSYTVNPCISASGKIIGRTFVTLMEKKAPRSFANLVAPYRKLYVTCNSSGKMTKELSIEWMEKVFLPSVRNNSVLLLDSWTGFNEMKKLPILKRKKIEVITFPKGTTNRLQPLDLSFNRQFKSFMKKLEMEVRSKTSMIVGTRDVKLQLLTSAINQFQAPRFKGLMQYGFKIIDLIPTHEPFETPASYCFNATSTAGKQCFQCSSFSFAKCGYCDQLRCVKCFIKHLH